MSLFYTVTQAEPLQLSRPIFHDIMISYHLYLHRQQEQASS